MSHRTLESHIKLPLGQTCDCKPGACWASPDGKARGRVSSISDMACRDAGPNTFTVRQDMLRPVPPRAAPLDLAALVPGGVTFRPDTPVRSTTDFSLWSRPTLERLCAEAMDLVHKLRAEVEFLKGQKS